MVSEVILDYLKLYRDKFSVEDLKNEILNKGYSAEEFYEALAVSNSKPEVVRAKYRSLVNDKNLIKPVPRVASSVWL